MVASVCLSGCLGTHYLKGNEKLLNRQSIKAPKGFATEPLKEQYVQKTNRKLFVLPVNWLVWMYYWGERHYHREKYIVERDSLEAKYNRKIEQAKTHRKKVTFQFRKQKKLDAITKKIEFGNKRMQWGEKVSVFDSANVKATVEKFNVYLFNKGYFLGKTTYQVKAEKRTVSVVYWIAPGPAYFYDTLIYKIPDSVVHKIILADTANSLLKNHAQFDQDKLIRERERIDLFLKDHGFYDFSRQYVDFDIDSIFRSKHQLALRIEIKMPSKRDYHKQFKIDSVIFTTDAGVKSASKRQSEVYRNITFSYFKNDYSKKILGQRIFIYKDSLYNRTNTLNTQRLLANLDNFKFVNINYDTTGSRVVANIFSSPLDRYAWTNEAGVTVTQGFPGPYYNLNFKKRNLFRGLESFDLNGRFGYEGVASATEAGNFYKSTEASINGSLTFPQFLFPLKEETGYRLGKYNPKTRLQAGYTYTDRPEYQRSITTVSNTYTWQNKKTIQYSLTLTSLSIIRSHIGSDKFQTTLENLRSQGNNLINSFKPSFVGSTIFAITWNPNNYGNNSRSSFYLRAQVEGGGTLFNFFTPTFITNEGLELYKYIRFNVDMRWNKIIDKNTVVAYRFNSGLGYAYSNNRALPYEKYFFAGGSNSVRAWRPRRLGVGSYPPALNDNPQGNGLFNYQFEKPGEILLEGSLELRKKLFGFVSGALFVDAGNVWSFNELVQSTGTGSAEWAGNTQFKPDQFFKEFGIGTGFGLRFDFSFLVLRLDVGIKAYDPARKPGDKFILDKVKFWGPYGTEREPVIYNIGIGYPF